MDVPDVMALFTALLKREREFLSPDTVTRDRIFLACISPPRLPAHGEKTADSCG